MGNTNLPKPDLDQRVADHRTENPAHVITKSTAHTGVHVTVRCKGDNEEPCSFFAHGATR